jgi:hypothetical protein
MLNLINLWSSNDRVARNETNLLFKLIVVGTTVGLCVPVRGTEVLLASACERNQDLFEARGALRHFPLLFKTNRNSPIRFEE